MGKVIFLVLLGLFLLFATPLEARPVPMIHRGHGHQQLVTNDDVFEIPEDTNQIPEKEGVTNYPSEATTAEVFKPPDDNTQMPEEEGITTNDVVTSEPSRKMNVLVGYMKNRYKGDQIHEENLAREYMLKHELSTKAAMSSKSNKPKSRSSESRTAGQTIVGGFFGFIKWLFIALLLFILFLYLFYKYMRFWCDCYAKHGDKIPKKKLAKLALGIPG